MEDLAEKIRNWVNSPEGQEALKQALEKSNKEVERLKQVQKIKPEDWNKPVDF